MDDLDEIVARRTARNPAFPRLLEATRRRRDVFRSLTQERERQAKTRAEVAAAMGDSEAYVQELETEAGDAELSAVDAYAVALGYAVQYHLIPLADAEEAPAVIIH